MIEPLFQHIEAGALILTANQRLARSLACEYDAAQRRSGGAAWPGPRVLSMGAWINSLWLDASLSGAVSTLLLSPLQEHQVWQQVIGESPTGRDLLQIPQAAREAAEAAALATQYRLPLRAADFEWHPDASAFLEWHRSFDSLCRDAGWTPRAWAPDEVARAITAGVVPIPERAILCGFDELTPQQGDFLTVLAAAGCDWSRFEGEVPPGEIRRASFADAEAEYRAAANWARTLVERDALSRIAVIVPSLAGARTVVERIFAEELAPGSLARVSPGASAFHISAGMALARVPIARAAMLALQLQRPTLAVTDASALLRSPYLRSSEEDAASRATLDVQLRRQRRRTVAVSQLRPAMEPVIAGFESVARNLPRLQPPVDWSRDFAQLLEAAGWPGAVALGSAEFQAKEAFLDTLEEFGSAELSQQPLDFESAYHRLLAIAEDAEFAIEDEGAPIQVMGVLEAAGSRFDALWVTGLHDGAWPQPPHPNPFLPVMLQRERNTPHCSAERELDFARLVTARLLRSAPNVVLSWPEMERDTPLRASPLLPEVPEIEMPPRSDWAYFLRQHAGLESLADSTGPVLDEATAAGGTGILKYQAACPFRAFAELRLGARGLEEPEPGIGPMERGNLLHKALDLVWREIGSHKHLCATSGERLTAIAERCVDDAFDQRLSGRRLRVIEVKRLAALILEWLKLERERAPFQVAGREVEREATVGGVRIRGRIDRVDRLPDGREIIIDYKANAPSLKHWEGDRPGEPQLPFYAVTHDPPLAAIAFANLKPGEPKFVGISTSDGLLPGIGMDPELSARAHQWRQTLERIARDYANGRAEVDPVKGACAYCRLTPLCRAPEACEPEAGNA